MDENRPTDIELMTRTARGDRDAFADLVRRYQHSLVNFFRRMGARKGETDDLVQDTFLRVFAHSRKYRPSGKFSNFIYVVARHAWADMARKAIRAPKTDELALANASVDAESSRTLDRLDVRSAVEGLSEKLREVVVLNVYQGLKYREVAEVMDIPLGTVKSRMHLALRKIREFLDNE